MVQWKMWEQGRGWWQTARSMLFAVNISFTVQKVRGLDHSSPGIMDAAWLYQLDSILNIAYLTYICSIHPPLTHDKKAVQVE